MVDGVTSLSPERARPAELLRVVRQHWQLEHQCHGIRDVTFDADRSQGRCSSIPQVMAASRHAAIGVMRWAGETNIAAARRRFAAQPCLALALIGITPGNYMALDVLRSCLHAATEDGIIEHNPAARLGAHAAKARKPKPVEALPADTPATILESARRHDPEPVPHGALAGADGPTAR